MQRSFHTAVLTFVFSLLMLGMQLEGQRHALQHLGDRLHRPHEQGTIGLDDEIELAASHKAKSVTDFFGQRDLAFAGDGGKHMGSLLIAKVRILYIAPYFNESKAVGV